MAFSLMVPLALCVLQPIIVVGCPYATRRTAQPLATASFPPVASANTVGMFTVPGGGISQVCTAGADAGCTGQVSWIEALSKLKQSSVPQDDLCYWSWQTLPPPSPLTAPLYNFSAIVADVSTVQSYGYTAYERLARQANAGTCTYLCGAVVWAGFTFGADMSTFLCAKNMSTDPALCASAHYTQSLRWPTASAIFRLTSTNAASWKAGVLQWRNDMETGHGPMVKSDLVWKRNWASEGQLTAKLFKCKDLPATYSSITSPPPTMSTINNGTAAIEQALQYWASRPGVVLTAKASSSTSHLAYTWCTNCIGIASAAAIMFLLL